MPLTADVVKLQKHLKATISEEKHSRTLGRKELDHQVIHYSLVFNVYIVGLYFCTNAASPPPNQSVAGIIY